MFLVASFLAIFYLAEAEKFGLEVLYFRIELRQIWDIHLQHNTTETAPQCSQARYRPGVDIDAI